jgi:asparagine synthase (glutamine-hydrolysing)
LNSALGRSVAKYSASRLAQFFSPTSNIRHKLDGASQIFNSHYNNMPSVIQKNTTKIPNGYMDALVGKSYEIATCKEWELDYSAVNQELNTFLLLDYTGVMRDLLLTKVDRATMSASLEGREPLLDHRIAEYAAQLPFEYKFDGTTLKKIIKEIVHQYVPKEIMDRPKTGFDLPIFDWLKTDLGYLIDEYLNDAALMEAGLNPKGVQQVVAEFRAGKLRYPLILWRLIVYQMWAKQWNVYG